MFQKLAYGGWPNCIRLFNDEIELIVATDIGPRLVRFGFINRTNFFYLDPEQAGKTGGDAWRIYGGHRFWLAPEAIPFSYNPDNEPVLFTVQENYLKLEQAKEHITGIVKVMEIRLLPDKNEMEILHRATNKNPFEITLAIWPISMLAGGGRAIIPQEPFGEGDNFLLPARSLALWQYTKMNDPCWIWGEKYIQAKQALLLAAEQKIGVTNKQGWVAYCLHEDVLIKKFNFISGAVYPDYSCNNEIYLAKNYLEVETLGPLKTLAPGETTEHVERWLLATAGANEAEQSIDENILPLVNSFK